ncbi:hypothetical protein MAPG_03651 [Magnaporthiopsis poae ATCC 64411]|uniref:Uncharacterized protein n=1 Tax=Magnaporthiopsis poae (strain ATCC 64411 / 73-15) TaxID=644358 RepID=A0A0C4DUL1_MAGP6|nr:hypothetical protein MAPG_03651 [Magnaporthiopsis poae ATCC 64411]
MGFTFYSGPSSDFHPMSEWKTLEEMFNLNKPEMLRTGDTEEDVSRIRNAVLE